MILHFKSIKILLDYIIKYMFNNHENSIANAVKIRKNLSSYYFIRETTPI